MLILAQPARSGPVDNPWDALRRLPKHQIYTVLNRDGSCLTGGIAGVSDSTLLLSDADQGQRQLARPGILRISIGETPDVRSTVYSGRSSWLDLQALHVPPYHSDLLIFTTDDRQFKGYLLGITSDQLSIFAEGKEEMRFAKEFISRVLLTRPGSEQTGVHRSLFSLPKRIVSPMQAVPLYEVTEGEDNSRVECSTSYRRPQ